MATLDRAAGGLTETGAEPLVWGRRSPRVNGPASPRRDVISQPPGRVAGHHTVRWHIAHDDAAHADQAASADAEFLTAGARLSEIAVGLHVDLAGQGDGG